MPVSDDHITPAATLPPIVREPEPAPFAPSDDALLAAIAQGEPNALGELYDRYIRLAMAVALRVLGDHAAAEDAVQAAFLSTWRYAADFDQQRGSARVWLLTIVRNAAVDRRWIRRASAWRDAPLGNGSFRPATEGDEPFAAAVARLDAKLNHVALAALPFHQRTAIEPAYFGGLTYREIAARSGAPLGTVKGRVRLGLHTLRLHLGDLPPHDGLVVSADCAASSGAC